MKILVVPICLYLTGFLLSIYGLRKMMIAERILKEIKGMKKADKRKI